MKTGNFQEKKIGEERYLNRNCWLTENLNYSPYKRCRYCELKFHNCLFLHYQAISSILIVLFISLAFLFGGMILNSQLVIMVSITVFTLVVVYGYFFNNDADKIIKASFALRKTNDALEELNGTLEQRVAEQTKDLKDAYDDLKELDTAKSEFVSIASHQLRTPLTAVKGYLSMMLEGTYGNIQNPLKGKLRNVFESSERLIKLVNDLLSVSKIEAGKIELARSDISVEDLISDIADFLKIEAKKKKISLKWSKPKKRLPKISIDPDKTREIISNIIDNSIKYTQKGSITVTAEERDNSILIKVSDTGEGLSEEEKEKIFQSFSRGTAGNQFYTEGAGLGLYVARKFVEMHDGKIWAESAGKGQGTTFYIELPVK
jgi:signal transduction histidine kinase